MDVAGVTACSFKFALVMDKNNYLFRNHKNINLLPSCHIDLSLVLVSPFLCSVLQMISFFILYKQVNILTHTDEIKLKAKRITASRLSKEDNRNLQANGREKVGCGFSTEDKSESPDNSEGCFKPNGHQTHRRRHGLCSSNASKRRKEANTEDEVLRPINLEPKDDDHTLNQALCGWAARARRRGKEMRHRGRRDPPRQRSAAGRRGRGGEGGAAPGIGRRGGSGGRRRRGLLRRRWRREARERDREERMGGHGREGGFSETVEA